MADFVSNNDLADFATGGGMRANVDELLKKKADEIKKLKSLCDQELLALDKEQYDDIFLLRYVLTHKDEYGKE